ncbi:MAG: cytochrome c family protein [Phenylobacterium sp.]|uniref:c-type cytochrome n=1 Tax=Phenylobacterium sp. TaxID=1871053 RepID=UPI002717C96A|nr:cytochrome c family protein [Phenylobacterium sp.]MDO8901111.1 cytochrome c family protein [Phenylobacterium sp.]MDP2215076.1 cytochrome c family protein [Phenylobacterium sp.]
MFDRTKMALAAAGVLGLAACGQGGGETPPAAKTAATQPSPAEVQALLASLPAPYNTADLDNGRRQFGLCRSCHTIAEGGPNLTGPNLHGMFGRQAASVTGYRYSDALQAADFVWDAERLNEWLANPRTYLPGNRMTFAGLSDPEKRVDLIAYLKVESGFSSAVTTNDAPDAAAVAPDQ